MTKNKKLTKRILFFTSSILLLTSCGGEDEAQFNEDGEYVANDSIIEYDIDQERVSAVEFNNELSLMQEDMLNMIEILFLSDSASVMANHENALFEAQINLSELDNMEFDGTELDFVAKMKELMNFYIDELDNGFREIIPLLQKVDLTDAEVKTLDEYDQDFANREKEIFLEVFAAQDEFAAANNISLE